MSRLAAMFGWRMATHEQRADHAKRWLLNEFRELRKQKNEWHAKHCRPYEGEDAETLNRMFIEDDPYSYQVEAVEEFVQKAIVEQRDDEDAAKASRGLMFAGDGWARGTIADAILYAQWVGPRCRAALLIEAQTDGKAGSILRRNGRGMPTLVEYFRETEPEFLMGPIELARLAGMPESVEVFRGARLKPGPFPLRKTAFSMSWTQDRKTANWFAERGHGEGEPVVMLALIPKEAILAVWDESGREPEVVVDPRRLRSIEVIDRPLSWEAQHAALKRAA